MQIETYNNLPYKSAVHTAPWFPGACEGNEERTGKAK
jgi:alpha-N-acetylglucosamine transferase